MICDNFCHSVFDDLWQLLSQGFWRFVFRPRSCSAWGRVHSFLVSTPVVFTRGRVQWYSFLKICDNFCHRVLMICFSTSVLFRPRKGSFEDLWQLLSQGFEDLLGFLSTPVLIQLRLGFCFDKCLLGWYLASGNTWLFLYPIWPNLVTLFPEDLLLLFSSGYCT